MRADFNNVMEVYTNDGSGGPADLVNTFDCRRVNYDQNVINSAALSSVELYANYVGGILFAGTTTFAGGVVQVDTTDAWVVRFLDDPDTYWTVRWCETWVPRRGGPYRRVHLSAP